MFSVTSPAGRCEPIPPGDRLPNAPGGVFGGQPSDDEISWDGSILANGELGFMPDWKFQCKTCRHCCHKHPVTGRGTFCREKGCTCTTYREGKPVRTRRRT